MAETIKVYIEPVVDQGAEDKIRDGVKNLGRDIGSDLEIGATRGTKALKSGLLKSSGNVRALSSNVKNMSATFEGSLKQIGKGTSDSLFGDLRKSESALVGAFFKISAVVAGIKGAIAGVAKAFQGISFSIRASADVEQLGVRLKALTGSADEAALVFTKLQDFSAKTPFRLDAIVAASSKLLAFGENAGTVQSTLRVLGNVAAATNADFGELTTIFGQINANSRLTGERLLQLEERAIPIGPVLAKSLGIAEAELRKFVFAGKVSAEQVRDAFIELGGPSGRFGNALVEQSQTLNGATSTLRDNLFLLGSAIGDVFRPAIVGGAKALTDSIGRATPIIREQSKYLRILSGIYGNLFEFGVRSFTDLIFGKDDTAKSKIDGINASLREEITYLNELQNKQGFQVSASDVINIVRTTDEIKRLNQEKNKLIDTQKRLAADTRTSFLLGEKQLDQQQTSERLAAEARAKIEKEISLKSLGNIGLSKLQIIRAQQAEQLEEIKKAFGKTAIEEQQAAERRKEVNSQAELQIAALRSGFGLTEAERTRMETENKIAVLKSELDQKLILEEDFQARKKKILKDAADENEKNSLKSTMEIQGAIASGTSSLIQNMVSLAMASELSIKSIGKALLGTIGELAIQVGTFFIAAGIGKLALIGSPGGEVIAAGVGLVALGSVLKGFSGGGSGASSGVSGTSIGQDAYSQPTQIDETDRERDVDRGINLTITGSGNAGTAIVELINEAFEVDGATIKTSFV